MIIQLNIKNMENNFEILVIKPNVIEQLDYNRVDYVSDILNYDCYENVTTNQEDIGIVFAQYLNSENYVGCNALTNICFETSEYLYELSFLDIPKDKKNTENYNQIATLLDITNEHIFGNAVLIKTHLPIRSLDMKLVGSSKEDIKKILDSRVNHLGVFIDTDKNIKQINFRDFEPKVRELLDEDPKDVSKIELPFLKHNFIMYYVKDSVDEKNELVSNIAQNTINGDVFIVSMITDKLYTDISVEEVKKMLAISKFGEDAWKPKPEYDEEEKDSDGRILIKSKYRILEKKYMEISNLD